MGKGAISSAKNGLIIIRNKEIIGKKVLLKN